MFKTGTGQSNNANARKAGAYACKKAVEKAGGTAGLIVVFSTVDYNQEEMLKGIVDEAKGALVAGCSSLKGIIDGVVVDKGVIVMAIASDKIDFKISIGQGAKEDPIAAGKILGKDLNDSKLRVVLMFLEAIGVNCSAIVRGIQKGARKNLPIIGGTASDDSTFTQTYQYANNKVLTNAVVGVGLFGKFPFGIGVQHGWESIGLPVTVTKSEGSIIQEIDGAPAIKFFEDYFGKEKAKQLYKPLSKICYVYPLGMSIEGSKELLIRNAFVATDKGEIVCAGEVPQGSQIRLMLGDPEKAIKAATEAAKNAKAQLKGASPKAVFIFSCAARDLLLGKRVTEEIQAIQEVFGKDVPLIGFYTYGEQAPLMGVVGSKCNSMFHNETMTMVVLGE